MDFEVLVKEIMWEYDCSKRTAVNLVADYALQNKYSELIDIIKFKRTTPVFERREQL